ncbi:hypothetical protein [Mollivirus kamchatka]|nr:hypothetical protein [Mollivirus kamchatka]
MALITPTTSTTRRSTKAGLNDPPSWIQDFHLRAVKDSWLHRTGGVATFTVPRLVNLIHKAYPEESARLTLEILSARETHDDLFRMAASVIDAGLDVFDFDTLVSTCAPQPNEDEDSTITILDPFDRSGKAAYRELTVTLASWRFNDGFLVIVMGARNNDDGAQVSSKQRAAWLSNWLKYQRNQRRQTQHDKESMRRHAGGCLARLTGLKEGDNDGVSRRAILSDISNLLGTAIFTAIVTKSGARISDALDLSERLLDAVMQSWTCRCTSPCRCLVRRFWEPLVSRLSLVFGGETSALALLVIDALHDRYAKVADRNNGHWPNDMTTTRATAACRAIDGMIAASGSASRDSMPHAIEGARDFYDITSAWILGEPGPATDGQPGSRRDGLPRVATLAMASSGWAMLLIKCVELLDDSAEWLAALAQAGAGSAVVERLAYSRSRLAGITWMMLDGFLFAGNTLSELLRMIHMLAHHARKWPWTRVIGQRLDQDLLLLDQDSGQSPDRNKRMLLVTDVVYIVCVSAGPSSCLHPLGLKCFARLLDAIYGGGRGDGLDLDMYLDLFGKVYAEDKERLKAVARWAEVCIAQAHDCPGIVVRDSTCDKVKALLDDCQ